MKKKDDYQIANKSFTSRLIIGTGKYTNLKEMIECIMKSESEIITVAIRRLNLFTSSNKKDLLTALNWKKLWLLPNTAGAKTIEEAIKLAFLGREICKRIGQFDNNFVKLEVISDAKYLLPDPIGTLKAAEFLVQKGFTVLPYTNNDPILAKHLEEIGCATIMPLGSPIGSGKGIQNRENIEMIINGSNIPIILDAGMGAPSDVSLGMELGAHAILLNSAIAQAKKPGKMAEAMKLGVQAGRTAYLAGKMINSKFAQASSPIEGVAL